VTATGLACPSCGRGTIARIGGEWCPRCRSFVKEVVITRISAERTLVERVLARPFP